MSKTSGRRLSADERAELASRVKIARTNLGLTQTELAVEAGVVRQTISNLENGTVPQQAKLERILAVLNIGDESREQFSGDTTMWLGMIGSVLDRLPTENRNRAGQAAVNVVTQELAAVHSLPTINVGGVTEDDDAEAGITYIGRVAEDELPTRLAADKRARKSDVPHAD